MTLPLEHIEDGDWFALNQALDTLRSLVLDTGGQSLGIRVGGDTATWAASTTSAGKVITHGLGRTPVLAAAFQNGTAAITYGASSVGDKTFTVTGFYTDHATLGNLTGTFSFFWVVIG